MKVKVLENSEQAENEALILCRDADDDEVQRALSLLGQLGMQLTGKKDGVTVPIGIEEILYFESVDKKTFIYTETDVLETPLRLYMLEERLINSSFFRASKNAIINLNKIASLKPEFGGRMEATLTSGERIMISRQYLPTLKNKLEM